MGLQATDWRGSAGYVGVGYGVWIYSGWMQDGRNKNMKMLLIDTCGEGASVALSVGDALVAQALLPGGRVGGSSAEIVSAVGRMLQEAGWSLRELGAVGVASGPGSFTGVRVGMATAKGLCEASGVKMIAVSRLAVLAQAVELTDGLVALDAGRGEFYVGERVGERGLREWMGSVEEIAGRQVSVAEAKVAAMLGETPHVLRPITMEDVLRTVLREFGAGDMTLVDANYVRRESDIYSRPAAGKL